MKFVYTLLLSIITVAASAQQVNVKGRVLDKETGDGEVGAIVQFIDPSANKAIAFTSADENGAFAQKLKGGKEYRILISNLGRKNIEKAFQLGQTELDLGDFLIENDATELNAASVTAQKLLVKMEVDKMTYNVSEDTDSKSATVLDMLRKVPMVTVDAQDNITVNGSSSFLVTVDGKPNQMLTKNASTVFKMMPASAIKNIEVITNPGVKYDAEGVGGVLNLTTEQGAAGGGSAVADGQFGSLSLNTGTHNSNVGGMLTMQRGKFSFSVNANIGKNHGQKMKMDNDISIETIQSSFGTAEYRSKTHTESKQTGTFGWGDFQASYEPDSLNLVSVNAGGFFYNGNSDSETEFSQGSYNPLNPTHNPTYQSYTMNHLYDRTNKDKNYFGNYNVGADWQHKFANAPGKTFTLSYKGSFNPGKNKNTGIFDPESQMNQSRKIDGKTNSSEHTFQADFTTALGKNSGNLSTGLKFIYRNNTSVEDLFLRSTGAGDFILDDASSTDYEYINKIGAAYAEYSNNFGQFGIKAGGRYEYTWQDVIYKKGQGNDFSVDYGSFVPMASLQYNLGMTQNIGLSYNVRISRPGISYLNPFVNTSDPTHISYGNPALDVAKSHNISLVYNFFSPIVMMSATLGHTISNDGISEYTFTDNNVLNTTYGNILKSNATRLNLFANLNLGKTSRIYANAGLSYNNDRSAELDYSKKYWTWNLYAGAQQTVFWDLRLSENLFMTPKHYTLQGWTSGVKGLAVGVTKTFLDDRLSIGINGVTHLGTGRYMKFEIHNEGRGYSSNTTVNVPIRQITVNFSWFFGKSSSARVKKASRTIQNDDVMEKASGDAASQAAGGVTGNGTGR
ncbi:MAG: TonB-dependent receptor [Bacteroidales bacterium]|nr:TonB-dependent receptor [Bacteroidales bacterium]